MLAGVGDRKRQASLKGDVGDRGSIFLMMFSSFFIACCYEVMFTHQVEQLALQHIAVLSNPHNFKEESKTSLLTAKDTLTYSNCCHIYSIESTGEH